MRILRQKNFFQAADGSYFTGEDLLKDAAKERAALRNGTIQVVRPNGKIGKDYKIDRGQSIRNAYIHRNVGGTLNPVEQKKAFDRMEKMGLVKNVKRGGDGLVSRYSTPHASKIKRLLKKLKIK